MTIVTGTVKYTKSGQGTPSKYDANVMRYNILVDLDKPLPNGDKQQRAYFNEGEQPYEGLQRGDRVYVMNAGTWQARLALIDEDAAAPQQVRQGQQQSQPTNKKKARNKYDVVEVDYSKLNKFVRGASAVMTQCIMEARTIRTAVYGNYELTTVDALEYDRALAVTLFIKATEGMQPTALLQDVRDVEVVENQEDEDSPF